MICDRCHTNKSAIIQTQDSDDFAAPRHPAPDSIFRRRRCNNCGHTWHTVEIKTVDYQPLDRLAMAEALLSEVREVLQA